MAERNCFIGSTCIFIASIFICVFSEVELDKGASSTEGFSFPAGHLKKLGEHGMPEEGQTAVLNYIPSGKDFYSHYIRKRRPLLMRGVAKNWKAVQNWKNETYLREKYGSTLMDVEMGKGFDGSHLNVRKTMNMSEFLDNFKTQKMYLDSPFPQSEMIADLEIPFCMQCAELRPTISSAHLLFSSGNTSSSLHHDGYENLFVLMSGKKEFRIFNYKYGRELYGPNCTSFPGLSPINPDSVDLMKYPDVAKIPYEKVTLEAGDLFYNPVHWWHHVRSYDSPNIGVSIWFHVFQHGEDDLPAFTDVLATEDAMARAIANAPESISCSEQNMPISLALLPDQPTNITEVGRNILHMVTLRNGKMMPMIGIGTGGDSAAFRKKIYRVVSTALASGYRLIDSSPTYNETAVGKAIENSNINRQDIFLISKVLPINYGFAKTVQSVASSLRDLRTSYIDMVLLNSKECVVGYKGPFGCDEDEKERETWREAWRALEYLVDIGKVREIGVCNFEIGGLQELQKSSKTRISMIQNWFDLFHNDAEVREFAKKNDITYVGFSTLGGVWQQEFGFNPVLQEKRLMEIADELDIDVARVVLHWAIRKGVVVLPRSQNVKHIQTNLKVDDFRLTEEEMEYLDSLVGKMNPSDFKSNKTKEDQDTEVKDTEDASKKSTRMTHYSHVQEKVDPLQSTIFVSSDDFWIYAFDAMTGKLKWKTMTGDETGSSCAFSLDGLIVYCGADDSYVRALSIIDGSLVWKFKTNGPVTSSAHVDKRGNIFIGSHDHFLYAISSSGELKWKADLESKVWSSPTSSSKHGLLYIGAYTDKIDNILAFDIKTGVAAWTFLADGPIIGSPRLSPDESTICIGDNSGKLHCLNAQSGHHMWTQDLGTMILSTPMISKDSEIFIGSHDGHLYGFNSITTEMLWKISLSKEMTSSPVLGKGDILYIGGGNGTVHAVRRSDGKQVWSKSIGKAIFFSSARLSTSGFLYIGSVDGPVYALNATSGDVIWQAKTDGPVVGTPLITSRYAEWYL